MPKGVYERTPEQKAILRERIRNAAKFERTPEQKAALRARLNICREKAKSSGVLAKNMSIGGYRRAARMILRNFPLDAKPGTTFKSGSRQLTVIDPTPVKVGESLWKQEFAQTVVYRVVGRKITIQGIARITWSYQPTNANVLDAPNLENVITSELENIPDSDNPAK